jgi:hypothetical protein
MCDGSKFVKIFTPLLLLLICMLCGCVAFDDVGGVRPRTSVEIQSMQTREFDTSYRIAFAAVVDVFQDLGYVIQSSDFTTGLIIAKRSTSGATTRVTYASSPFEPAVFNQMLYGRSAFEHGMASAERFGTVHVEELSDYRVSIRVSFVRCNRESYPSGHTNEYSSAVEDNDVYVDFFSKIDKSIFVRQNFR